MKKALFLTIAASLALSLLFLIDNIKFDNAKWLADSHQVEINKKFVQENFLKGEELVVIFDLKGSLFSENLLRQIEGLDQAVNDLDIIEAKTPITATVILEDQENITLTDILTAYQDKTIQNSLIAEQELKKSLYYKNLSNQDLTKILLTIRHELPDESSHYNSRKALIGNVVGIIEQYDFYISYQLSGTTYLNFLVDDLNIKNLKLLLTIALILVFGFLALIYRNIIKLLLVTLSSIACLVYSLALFYLFDYNVTVINMVLPILIIVIALSDSIFITSRADLMILRYKVQESFMRDLIKRTWLPCLLTSVTTSIGFGSFYFSEILPLKKLAIISIPAILGSYLIIVCTNWISIYLLSGDLKKAKLLEKKRNELLRFILRTSRNLVKTYPKIIIITFSLVAFVFALGLLKIYTETNFLKIFFKDKSEIVQSFAKLDTEFNGSSKVDIIFSDQDYEDIEVFNGLNKTKEILKEGEQVKDVISYHEVIKKLHNKFSKDEILPKNSEQLAQEILFLEFSRSDNKEDVLEPYLSFNKDHTRMEVRTNNLTSKEIDEMLADMKLDLPEKGYFLSGDNYYFHSLSKYIITTQIRSVFITFAIITLLILLIFGYKTAVISIIPNLMPPTITLGTIALLGIPFDFSTILIAAISFGITVDSSIHLIDTYQNLEEQHFSNDKIRRHLLNTVGKPIVISAVVFSLMFLLFIFADLVILIKFGLFSFLAIITSLLINLLLIPAILRVKKKS